MNRNFSMQAYWEALAGGGSPEQSFREGMTYEGWKAAAVERLLGLLGRLPEPVDPNPAVESTTEEDGLLCERVVLDTEAGLSVPCIVLRPRGMAPDGSHAAILCCHGHAAFAKDVVAGMRRTPEHEDEIRRNGDFARRLALAGYLTISPDLRGFGERKDGVDPFPGRDRCNINFLKGALLGYYTMTLNLWDLCGCVDYLQTRPEVDPARIGMAGLSLGGTMTMLTAALDMRIKAAVISGFINSWRAFALRDANFCGAQVLPEIHRYFDTHDIAGLIAPRPLMLHMGRRDDSFSIGALREGAAGVERIYRAAGCGDRLVKNEHDGGHIFDGQAAIPFFQTHL